MKFVMKFSYNIVLFLLLSITSWNSVFASKKRPNGNGDLPSTHKVFNQNDSALSEVLPLDIIAMIIIFIPDVESFPNLTQLSKRMNNLLEQIPLSSFVYINFSNVCHFNHAQIDELKDKDNEKFTCKALLILEERFYKEIESAMKDNKYAILNKLMQPLNEDFLSINKDIGINYFKRILDSALDALSEQPLVEIIIKNPAMIYSLKNNYPYNMKLVKKIIKNDNEVALIRFLKIICQIENRNVRESLNNSFVYASSLDKEKCVIALLTLGANVNFVNIILNGIANMTALMAACNNGHKKMVELLFENKADINFQNSDGFRALMIACGGGSKEIVELLLENGADINAQNNQNYTALMIACNKAYKEIVELLLENGAGTNFQNNNGSTALMVACRRGYKEIVALLLQNGADISVQNNNGFTALMIACRRGYKEIVNLLLENGADINVQNNNGFTALMIACAKDNKEIVELLLKNGADVNLQCHDGSTVLFEPCQQGSTEIVRLLLAQQSININAAANGYGTPFYMACQEGHTEIVKLLLAQPEIDINAKGQNKTPLIVACINKHTEIVRLLLERGDLDRNQILNVSDDEQNIFVEFLEEELITPLDIAQFLDHTEIIVLLKKAGFIEQRVDFE